MNNQQITVLHYLRTVKEKHSALQFLASILSDKTGQLDMIHVEERLDRITDDARRDLAKEQQLIQGNQPIPERVLSQAKKQMEESLPEFDLNTFSPAGDPVEQVLSQLNRKQYGLLSMESYGRGGFRNVLGAHVKKIVKKSPVPTLVYKGELDSCERVLIPVPNDRDRSTTLISYLSDLLGASQPAITLLVTLSEEGEKFGGYTSGEEEYLKESLENYAREEFGYLDLAREIISEHGMEAEVRYRTGEVQEEILAEAKEGRYDLMAFSPEKQNVLTSIWSGDKSFEVMRDIDMSVLKFPPPEES